MSNLVWQCARCDGFQGLSLSINHHEHKPSVCVNNTNPDFEGTKRETQTNFCRMEKIISAAPFLELLRHLFTLHKERSCRCKLSFINHYQLHTAHQFGIPASALHAEKLSFENELSFWTGKHRGVRSGFGRKCNQDSVSEKNPAYFDCWALVCHCTWGKESTREYMNFFFLLHISRIFADWKQALLPVTMEKRTLSWGSCPRWPVRSVAQLGCLTNGLTLEQKEDIQ